MKLRRFPLANRRAFIKGSSVAALSPLLLSGPRAKAQSRSKRLESQLLAAIDPELLSVRKELPRHENAYWIWAEAAKGWDQHEFATHFATQRNLSVDDEHDLQRKVLAADTPLRSLPEGLAGTCIREMLASVEPVLAACQIGLTRGRYQIPDAEMVDFLKQLTALVSNDKPSRPRAAGFQSFEIGTKAIGFPSVGRPSIL